MTTLPLHEHPIVIAAATEMARERWVVLQSIVSEEEPHDPTGWDHVPAYGKRRHIAVNARLLCSLDRPASRDWWVRWGARHVGDTRRRELHAIWTEHEAENGPAHKSVRDAFVRGSDADADALSAAWSTMRNNPEALATAILGALG